MTEPEVSAQEAVEGALNAMPADVRPVELVNRDRAAKALTALTDAGYVVTTPAAIAAEVREYARQSLEAWELLGENGVRLASGYVSEEFRRIRAIAATVCGGEK
jgi:hypothetical protein